MSNSQSHGKTFEREVITKCFGVAEDEADKFGNTAVFDIPFGITTCQHPTGDPVSIKTAAVKAAAKAATVCLSDASRVWAWDQPLILVVGLYSQNGETKMFHTVYEFHLRLDRQERGLLYGELTLAEVSSFHKTLKTFGQGEHAKARAWAKAEKKRLAPKTGHIQLNPKIDSKTQRRLQCSVRLPLLVDACKDTRRFTENETGKYRGLSLPFPVDSGARVFSKGSAV